MTALKVSISKIFQKSKLKFLFRNTSKKTRIKYILFATGRDFHGKDLYCEDILNALDRREVFIIDWKPNNRISNSFYHINIAKYFNLSNGPLITLENFESSKFYLLQENINRHFSININLLTLFQSVISSFEFFQMIYNALLNNLPNVKKCFNVYISGGSMAMPFEARKRGIKTIELQHGIMLEDNFDYQMPQDLVDKHYFPDEIYAFGSHSIFSNMPVTKKIEFTAPKTVREFLAKNIKRNPKQILFIGQTIVGNFFDIAKDLARLLPDYEIKHILHPSEIKTKNEINIIIEGITNFQIYNNRDINIYCLLKSSEIIVSKMSAVLMEAVLFQNRIFIININNNITALQDFIDIGAYPIKSAEELKDGILSGKGKIRDGEQNRYYNIKTKAEIESIIKS